MKYQVSKVLIFGLMAVGLNGCISRYASVDPIGLELPRRGTHVKTVLAEWGNPLTVVRLKNGQDAYIYTAAKTAGGRFTLAAYGIGGTFGRETLAMYSWVFTFDKQGRLVSAVPKPPYGGDPEWRVNPFGE